MTESEPFFDETHTDRELRWEKSLKTTDDLGEEMGETGESPLREVVAALSGLGFKVTQFSSGAVYDKSTIGPYVAFRNPVAMRFDDASGEAMRTFNSEAATRLASDANTAELQLRDQLEAYIGEFSVQRASPMHSRLMISDDPVTRITTDFSAPVINGSLLHNRGLLDLNISTAHPPGRQTQLHGFQEELREFGYFMKAKFFNPPTMK